MRGERKISKLVSMFSGMPAWYGEEFMLTIDNGNPGISWTDGESAMLNQTWAYRLMTDYGFKLTNENIFIMSILHEIGHAITVGNFTTEEWNIEYALKEKIGEDMTEENWFEMNQKYFLMPTEKAATDWAIETYRTNPIIKRWQRRFNCAVRHYEKVSGRRVFERI